MHDTPPATQDTRRGHRYSGGPSAAREGNPYRADTVDAALDAAARRYLGSAEGLRVDGNTLLVSSIFKWYGDDFIRDYAATVPASGPPHDRAILGAIVRFAPAAVAELARTGRPRLRYLDYDWSLNDVAR